MTGPVVGGPGLDATLRVEPRDVEVELHLHPGETLALLGPNGAGKSTVLAALAGVLRPDTARVVLGEDVLADSSTGRWAPPHARGVALLAQEPLLFPHLDARENVAFGPRSTGTSRRAARREADAWLGELGVGELAERRPASLSGGQAQRVAVARALATAPGLLLLDEPMAALDVSVVPGLRRLLRRVLAGRTTLLVTHDVLDAALLADRVAVMEQGRIVEVGPTQQVLTRPRSTFGARIAGLNLLRGVTTGAALRDADGHLVHGTSDGKIPDGSPAVAVFSPSAVAVHRTPPGGSPRNVFAATVTEVEPRGDRVRVRTTGVDADISLAAVAELDLAPGSSVHLVVKATEVALHPA